MIYICHQRPPFLVTIRLEQLYCNKKGAFFGITFDAHPHSGWFICLERFAFSTGLIALQKIKKTPTRVSFCFVNYDLFEPPWLRLNFFWQVVELAFSINKVHKKIFPLLNFSIYSTILHKVFQSILVHFFLNLFFSLKSSFSIFAFFIIIISTGN